MCIFSQMQQLHCESVIDFTVSTLKKALGSIQMNIYMFL